MVAAQQWLAAAGREVEMARRRTGARGIKIEEARAAMGYLKHERVVGGNRGGRRWASDGDRRRHGRSMAAATWRGRGHQ